jgi:hypothetical protein
MSSKDGGKKIVGLAPDRHSSFYGRDIVSVKQFSPEDLYFHRS